MAIMYIMSTSEVETNVMNPFKDVFVTKKEN